MAEREGHYPYQAPVDAYGDGGFRFAEMSHRGSILCLPSGMYAWDVADASELSLDSLRQVLAEAGQIDVLFIGMGADIRPLPSGLRQALREHDIIVEAVGTGSAISVYNILLSENRAVAAALIATDRPKRT